VKDSEWIADLLRHGLIRKSYVPPKDLRELRDLLRYRVKLVQSRTSECNRLQRLLETASIKLASVMTDVFGVSGRAMLDAIVKDGYVPADVAQLARGVLRKKTSDLALALDGRIEEHHRFMLGMQLRRIDQLDADIAAIDARIDAKLEPYRVQFEALRPFVLRATAHAEPGRSHWVRPADFATFRRQYARTSDGLWAFAAGGQPARCGRLTAFHLRSDHVVHL
jgi:hypothetical protein